jgi:hypothetical protein
VIPLLKVPPIILAAVARASNDSGDDLYRMHEELMALLHQYNIYPITFAADGTEIERALQRQIETKGATHTRPYAIHNHVPGAVVKFNLLYQADGKPLITIQDSKHAAKTARNNLFTGARMLVIGFFVAFYAQVRALAYHPFSPLFRRDVDRVDRQDDRAAARLFSASSLQTQLEHFPNQPALSVSFHSWRAY